MAKLSEEVRAALFGQIVRIKMNAPRERLGMSTGVQKDRGSIPGCRGGVLAGAVRFRTH